MRIRRRNIAWLTVLAALIGVVLLSGAASAELMTLLVALFGVAFVASMLEFQPERLRSSISGPSPLTRMRMSSEAREATDRAHRRIGSYQTTDLTLLDIGLISSQANIDGMVMRKSRTISADDDGVRPFVSLYVPPSEADRQAVLRFEIMDQNGDVRYVHETKTYLRDGEMNILADHHLPLLNNPEVSRAGGDWDLRVSVDSVWLGLLSFTLTPSVLERERDIERSRSSRLSDRAAETPMSFEDLLRGQDSEGR